MMSRTVGWPHTFRERAWAEIRDEHLATGKTEINDPVLAVIDSVIGTGKADVLAASTSMMDLMVVPRPIPTLPYDVLLFALSMLTGSSLST